MTQFTRTTDNVVQNILEPRGRVSGGVVIYMPSPIQPSVPQFTVPSIPYDRKLVQKESRITFIIAIVVVFGFLRTHCKTLQRLVVK